jgi:hypothetical protein
MSATKGGIMSFSRIALAVAAFTLCIPLADAQDAVPSHPALTDKFYFAVGAFTPKTSTSASLESSNLGAGASIDFERALGMETQKMVPDAAFRWRFGDRWRLEAEYFELRRTGDKVIGQDITWNGITFLTGTQIQSKFNFSDIRTSVGYSFFKTKDKEVGVSFGFHVASYDVGLQAVTGAAAAAGDQAKKILAPLPVLSAYGQFALTDEWAVGARLDRFAMTYDNYNGNVTSIGADVNYQPFRHVGFGLAYRSLFIVLKANGPDYAAEFNQTFQGPLLYMNASF